MAPLFQISLLHRYFSNGKLDGALVLADSSTRQVIDRYRLIARMQDGVFSLCGDFQGGKHAFVSYLEGLLGPGAVLRFYVVADQRKFFFITDLPLDWLGQLEFSSGLTEKTVGGQIDLLPVLGSGNAGWSEAVAVISIRLQDLLLMGDASVRYVIDLHARKVGWRYYLINRSEYVLKNPVVTGNNGQLFYGPETALLPAGDRALVFSSEQQQFSLQQTPLFFCNLVDKLVLPLQSDGQAVEHTLIKGLPTPKQDQLSIVHTAGLLHAVCAMHVYL